MPYKQIPSNGEQARDTDNIDGFQKERKKKRNKTTYYTIPFIWTPRAGKTVAKRISGHPCGTNNWIERVTEQIIGVTKIFHVLIRMPVIQGI